MSARSSLILAAQALAVLLWLTVLAAVVALAWCAVDHILTRRRRRAATDREIARRYRPDHLDLHSREEGRQP
ncbi:hypothetical protein [Streptomyces sp. NPDC059994]|uniref:hypothetical protein n=1 Tax=Streptomyces sp. NPDC059994 TaxID=3347029 RepID=UPI00367F91DF